jgi:hypothetical protein
MARPRRTNPCCNLIHENRGMPMGLGNTCALPITIGEQRNRQSTWPTCSSGGVCEAISTVGSYHAALPAGQIILRTAFQVSTVASGLVR